MADQRKVQLILGISTTGAPDAAAGLASISKAAESLKGELTTLQRGDALKDLGVVAAQVAAQTGDIDAAAARLAEELKAVGATEKEIRKVSLEFERTTVSIEKARAAQEKLGAAMAKDIAGGIEKARAAQEKLGAAMAKDAEKARATQEKLGAQMSEDIEAELRAQTKLNEQKRLALTGATSLQKELNQISRADQIQKIGAEMGLLARKTKDVGGAVADLNKKLKELGASEDEIRGAASAFSSAQTGGGVNRLARAGSEIRALPSTQIPGLGIGTDAIGNFLRLGGALSGVSEKAAEASKLGLALTPVLGQTAAGIATVGLAAATFAAPIALVALALKALGDQAASEAEKINAIVDSQRSVGQDIARGLTSEEANKQIEELNRLREDEIERVAKLKQNYQDNINSAGALTPALKLLSGAEEALNSQINTGTEDITTYETKIAALTLATQDGSLAANDAAEAEKKLAEERSKAALNSADSAAKELQAQQKALNATEEQNKKRLETIEEEKAVAEKQIAVLEASGVTSEEVTAKIAALKDQLGLLGNESKFIKDTALEASREADAAKKAKKDQEDAEKKAEAAQEQYTKAVKSATDAYKNSVADIGTRLRQTLSDNTLKLNRDLTDLSTKYERDQYDLMVKSQRAERDAVQDQINDLEDIRRNAAKDEQQALQEGDFKALFLARKQGEEALQQTQTDIERERQQRAQSQAYALEDLRRNNERQRHDRIAGYERQNFDARTAQQRELQQAALTRNRALQIAAEGQNAGLTQFANFWKQMNNIQQQGINNALNMTGASTRGANANSPFGAFQSQFKAVMSR